jgi:hypothetical protein
MANTRIKENAMSMSRIAAAAALCLALAGCFEQVVVDPNNAPVALARAVDPATNMPVAGMVQVPYNGAPATVTLDGMGSTDDDGHITRYQWQSGNSDPDAGMSRSVPAGEAMDWPADRGRTDVALEQGQWTFVLYVQDDKGVYSDPDTIVVNVGTDPVMECADMIVDGVADACKLCMCAIESCRPMVIESACNAECWALIQCIGANCPNFQMMAAMSDFSCLTGNCMAQYTANMGGSTPMGATPAGACARMCPADCTSMPTM